MADLAVRRGSDKKRTGMKTSTGQARKDQQFPGRGKKGVENKIPQSYTKAKESGRKGPPKLRKGEGH